MNYEFLVQEAAEKLGEGNSLSHRPRREPLKSDLTLLSNLPHTRLLKDEARSHAMLAEKEHYELLAQLEQEAKDAAFALEEESRVRAKRRENLPKWFRRIVGKTGQGNAGRAASQGEGSKTHHEYFDLLRAIEKKDMMELMDIKTNEFDLLIRPSGGIMPLVYAMRLGPSHMDVAVLLTGALSKKVNEITDSSDVDLSDKTIASTLKAIRANLKIAISFGLAFQQTDLVASYLQVIIMSQGNTWLQEALEPVVTAVETGDAPVATASSIVEEWAKSELRRGAARLADVQDYLCNAAIDLVLMAMWQLLDRSIGKNEPPPTHFFGRDNRVANTLFEYMHSVSASELANAPPGLLSKIDKSVEIVTATRKSRRARQKSLSDLLDDK